MFPGFDALRRTRRLRLPLAARLLQFFAPKEGLLMETDSESPAGAGISGSSALMIAATAAATSRILLTTDASAGFDELAGVRAEVLKLP